MQTVAVPQNWTLTFYLHDAVYLYLQTVHHLIADSYSEYKDGQFIRNKTIGQRFVGRHFLDPFHGAIAVPSVTRCRCCRRRRCRRCGHRCANGVRQYIGDTW